MIIWKLIKITCKCFINCYLLYMNGNLVVFNIYASGADPENIEPGAQQYKLSGWTGGANSFFVLHIRVNRGRAPGAPPSKSAPVLLQSCSSPSWQEKETQLSCRSEKNNVLFFVGFVKWTLQLVATFWRKHNEIEKEYLKLSRKLFNVLINYR